MTEDLEKKLETREVLRKDIIKNFAFFSAVAEDPNEDLVLEGFDKDHDDKLDTYGLKALDHVIKNVSKETMEYLKPLFLNMGEDHKRNGEFSPWSKDLFKSFANTYTQAIYDLKGKDFLKLAEEYGFENQRSDKDDSCKHLHIFDKDNVCKQLQTNQPIKEVWFKYLKQKKDNDDEKNAEEFEADAVVNSIAYIQEYMKMNSKFMMWNHRVNDLVKSLKEVGDDPKKYVKAIEDARKAQIAAHEAKIRELRNNNKD